jgi:hypothetical protein
MLQSISLTHHLPQRGIENRISLDSYKGFMYPILLVQKNAAGYSKGMNYSLYSSDIKCIKKQKDSQYKTEERREIIL